MALRRRALATPGLGVGIGGEDDSDMAGREMPDDMRGIGIEPPAEPPLPEPDTRETPREVFNQPPPPAALPSMPLPQGVEASPQPTFVPQSPTAPSPVSMTGQGPRRAPLEAPTTGPSSMFGRAGGLLGGGLGVQGRAGGSEGRPSDLMLSLLRLFLDRQGGQA